MSATLAADTIEEFVPATPSELSRFLSDNAARDARPLCPVGGRTALNFGLPADESAITISTARLADTIDYPARDMTVTVESGVRVEDLAKLLRAEGQRLPLDIAQAHRATLGGAIACNCSGPRRYGLGTFRDYVIGISAQDAHGRAFKAGGRVVKNVAGYDLCKLLIGSLGTLGIITQVTLKLRPIPEAAVWLWASFDQLSEIEAVLARLLTSAARPVAMEVLNPSAAADIARECRSDFPSGGPVLALAVEGAEREAAWQATLLQEEIGAFRPRQIAVATGGAVEPLVSALTEYQTSSEEPVTFQANLLPSRTLEFMTRAHAQGVSLQAHAGNGIVIGHLPDAITTAEQAASLLTPLRQFARQSHGNLVILHCERAWKGVLPVFGEPAGAWELMRKLKHELDPHDLWNRGRMWKAASASQPV